MKRVLAICVVIAFLQSYGEGPEPLDLGVVTYGEDEKIGNMVDAWHKAAAVADSAGFFGAFYRAESIYQGTDETERWTRDEMAAWAAPYFQREEAWTFVPDWRNVRFSKDGRIAWWDEQLDSDHMGRCRGNGIAIRTPNGWKIDHYVLSFTVPNSMVGELMALYDNGK